MSGRSSEASRVRVVEGVCVIERARKMEEVVRSLRYLQKQSRKGNAPLLIQATGGRKRSFEAEHLRKERRQGTGYCTCVSPPTPRSVTNQCQQDDHCSSRPWQARSSDLRSFAQFSMTIASVFVALK
jgi:hypothetical protein